MLTIKHIDKRGDERLVECGRFTKERRSDGFMQFMAFAHGALPGEYLDTWCGDDGTGPNLIGDGLGRHTIYVMNRVGSTVAVYRFDDPDFISCGRAMCADPAALGQVSA